tara:strand:- start:136 stop:591 length:456 start_codon:yes stop_codon:yes gene_type:complete
MKLKILTILVFSLICNTAIAKDKYTGYGELLLSDSDIRYFMDYLNAPAGQSPSAFYAVVENGKVIWLASWYCPEGSCQAHNKSRATKQCVRDAEKYYKNKKRLECFLFAQKRVIKWDNDINTGHWKKSAIKSRLSISEVKTRLAELGFYKN